MSNTDLAEKPLMHLNDFVGMWQKALSDQAAKIADLELKLAAMTKERDELQTMIERVYREGIE